MTLSCADLTKRLPQFMDDLLREPEHAEFRAHLASCAGCQQYAATVGSLAHAVALLGTARAPDDLIETVRFEFAKRPAATKAPAAAQPSQAGPVAAVLIGMLVLLALVFVWRARSAGPGGPAADVPVRVTATIERPGRNASDAAVYAQLQAMASALGVEGADAPGGSYQWTASYANEAQRLRVLQALRDAGLRPEYEAPELLVLSLSAGQLRQLLEALRRIPVDVAAPDGRLSPPGDASPAHTLQLWIHLRGAQAG